MTLPTSYPHPIHLAVIGGTGISHLTHEGFTAIAQIPQSTLHTPWGLPSSPITILLTPPPHRTPIAFLARHGIHHNLLPSEVPAQANIAALRSLGVRCILAFSAVGSLQEHIRPKDFVLPTQVIDATKGIRGHTFFGKGVVGHVGFAEPFDRDLLQVLAKVGKRVCKERGVELHTSNDVTQQSTTKKNPTTLICIEGPQFSTFAESTLYRLPPYNCSVINMSCIPESKLAREAEIAYAMICMSTDYDCWKLDEGLTVDVATVMANMKSNGETAKHLVAEVLEELVKDQYADLVRARHLEGKTAWAVCTAVEGRGKEGVERLEWLFGGGAGEAGGKN